MKKILALTTLLAGSLLAGAAPLPALADTGVAPSCVIFPLLRADCRAAIAEATDVALQTGANVVPDTIDHGWSCERRTDGKALFQCSK